MILERLSTVLPALCATVLLTSAACQPSAETDTTPPDEGEATVASPTIILEPLSDSPQFPGATLSLLSPQDGELEAGAVQLQFSVENYELGVQSDDAADKGIANSADGQHIHLIVDNGPYSALYEPSAEVELAAQGSHVVLAFLSRSYHESVKEPGAWVLRELRTAGTEPSVDPSAPHLFYSRPKGAYAGPAAERIMVDFYLLNVELSPSGNRVRLSVEGNEFLIDEWRPFVLEGLPDGEVTLTLELLDAEGEIVPGPFNRTTRTITVQRDDA